MRDYLRISGNQLTDKYARSRGRPSPAVTKQIRASGGCCARNWFISACAQHRAFLSGNFSTLHRTNADQKTLTLTQWQRMVGNSIVRRVIRDGTGRNPVVQEFSRVNEPFVQKQPAVTWFEHRARLYRAASGRRAMGVIRQGQRIHILERGGNGRRHYVRVESGPLRDKQGFLNPRHVIIPKTRRIRAPRFVRLVFFQNPERLGTTVESIGVGIPRRRTWLYRFRAGRLRRCRRIPARRRKVFLNEFGHTATHFYVSVRLQGKYRYGYVYRDRLQPDIKHRRKERRFFLQIARRYARERRSIYVDPRSQRCVNRSYPIEFLTASEIQKTIVGAANCTSALVDEIRIVGHGGRHGIAGEGDVKHYHGLYINELLKSRRLDPGGLTVRQFVKQIRAHLSDRVTIRIHACLTGERRTLSGERGFARALADELRKGGLSGARVYGMRGKGRPDRPGSWRGYP